MVDDLEARYRAVALLKGWQVRKIVSCGEVASIVRKIQNITNYQKTAVYDPNSQALLPMIAYNRK